MGIPPENSTCFSTSELLQATLTLPVPSRTHASPGPGPSAPLLPGPLLPVLVLPPPPEPSRSSLPHRKAGLCAASALPSGSGHTRPPLARPRGFVLRGSGPPLPFLSCRLWPCPRLVPPGGALGARQHVGGVLLLDRTPAPLWPFSSPPDPEENEVFVLDTDYDNYLFFCVESTGAAQLRLMCQYLGRRRRCTRSP